MVYIYDFFNTTSQLSGAYSLLYSNKETFNNNNNAPKSNNNDKSKTVLAKGISDSIFGTFGIILAILCIIIIYISYKNMDLNIEAYKDHIYTGLLIETLIFAFFSTIPSIMVMHNRTKYFKRRNTKTHVIDTVLSLIFVFIYRAIIHIIFQTSGFYKNTFEWI